MGPTDDRALPVQLDVDAHLRAQLVPFLEGELGWQVTDGRDLPPVLGLVGVQGAPRPGLPTVLLVRDEDPPARAAARAAGGVADVVAWPADRDRLTTTATRLLDRRAAAGGALATVVRVGGAAGGVGTTTCTLALGGLLAWRGRRCLVVVSGDVPVPDVPVVSPEALAAHRTWDAAADVAGVPGLRVLATAPGHRAPAAVPDDVVVLRDDGATSEVDVLVCIRDRAGRAAVDASAAAVVLVGDRGPLDPVAWRRRLPAGTRQLALPWSSRVARAGVVRRVPASLPGRWLRLLSPLAHSLASTAPGSTDHARPPRS